MKKLINAVSWLFALPIGLVTGVVAHYATSWVIDELFANYVDRESLFYIWVGLFPAMAKAFATIYVTTLIAPSKKIIVSYITSGLFAIPVVLWSLNKWYSWIDEYSDFHSEMIPGIIGFLFVSIAYAYYIKKKGIPGMKSSEYTKGDYKKTIELDHNDADAYYNSGVPYEVKSKLNWGAFLIPWIWGIGNGVWIALLGLIQVLTIILMCWGSGNPVRALDLLLVIGLYPVAAFSALLGGFRGSMNPLLALTPILGLAVQIYLLIKGNELAWKSRKYDSVEHFFRVQRIWLIVVLVIIGSPFILYILSFSNEH